jgi:hypothetical protein
MRAAQWKPDPLAVVLTLCWVAWWIVVAVAVAKAGWWLWGRP